MSEHNQAIALVWRLIIGLLVVAGLAGVVLMLLRKQTTCLSVYGTSSESARRSLGEEILVREQMSEEKRAGVQAFAQCNFQTAAAKLEASLVDNRNDPEALIYLQNAKAAASGETLKIVASVPIGENVDFAEEILRGVAQGQKEVNGQGGINGKQLLVEIANDYNDNRIVKKLAAEFVADPKILAVVGYNSSGSTELTQFQNYEFRTVPSARVYAKALVSHATGEEGNDRDRIIAICADSQDSYSKSFKKEFTEDLLKRGGRLANINCDLAVPSQDFDANAIFEAIAQEADGLLLSASYTNLSNAISTIEANKKRLPLFATRNMYVNDTIQEAGEDAEGMVLAVPWHPDVDTGNFFTKAYELWGGEVNWRSAMAYDAVGAIIEGLKKGNSREELKEALSNPGFSVQGATGTVRFLPGVGDRLAEDPQNEVKLVTVREKSETKGEYEFVPLPSDF